MQGGGERMGRGSGRSWEGKGGEGKGVVREKGERMDSS